MINPRIDLLPNVSAFTGPSEEGYRGHSYVISFDDFSVLVDVNDDSLLDALRDFPPPRHLILTHRHLRRHEAALERAFGLQVWIHPEDALAPRRGPAKNTLYASTYRDPFSGGLEELGLQFFNVPGHTPGCMFILLRTHGGMIFVGDAVIGAKPVEPTELHMPPDYTCDDPQRAITSVLAVELPPHCSVLPSHGEPIVAVGTEQTAALWAKLKARLTARPAPE